MYYLKIDVRERDLCAALQGSAEYTVESLHLGDVAIVDENGKEHFLFERKTVADLMASITDGRYEEQSARLSAQPDVHAHNIIYIVEGVPEKSVLGVPAKRAIFYSSMISTMYYKGFSVFRTSSVKETAEYVSRFLGKLNSDLKKGRVPKYNMAGGGGVGVEEHPSYASVIKKVKKENVNPENICEIMLCQIPGISNSTAETIVEKYATMPELVDALRTDPTCLDELKYKVVKKDGGEMLRKLNRPNIENIFKYFGMNVPVPEKKSRKKKDKLVVDELGDKQTAV